MKIFITRINTELGYHLVETLRQDHIKLSDYPLISGTLSISDEFALHNSIHKSFDFLHERDNAVKCVMQSDILIIDIRNNPGPQVQFILKVLKHYNRKTQLKVVGISNFMTWSSAKINQFDEIPRDKDELIDFALHQNKWIEVKLEKENYQLRQPHPMFVYNYMLEEQIMQLKYHQVFIKPKILCIGLLYGLSGMDFYNEIQNAITCSQSQLVKFKTIDQQTLNKKLPFIHIEKLLQAIKNIVDNRENSSQILKNEYTILCENKPESVLQIVDNLHLLCGHAEFTNLKRQTRDESQPNIQIPELVLTRNKRLFSFLFNLHFSGSSTPTSSQQGKHLTIQNNQTDNSQVVILQNSNKTCQLALQMIKQFRNYHQISFKHFILTQQLAKESEQLGKEFSLTQTEHKNDEIKERVIKMLLRKYSLLDKDRMIKICSKLIQSGQIPQERLVTQEQEKKKQKPQQKNDKKQSMIKKQPYELFFPQIIRKFLKQNQDSNFIIYLQHELVAKILALLQDQGSQQLRNIKFILFVKKKLQQSHNNSVQFMNEKIETRVQMFSKEFFEITGINETTMIGGLKQDEISNQLSEELSRRQDLKQKVISNSLSNKAPGSEETKVNLLSQYLLDNVIVYLAEAKHGLTQKGVIQRGQNIEGKQNIELFIQQLKAIYQREEQFCENESDEEKQS